MIAMHVWRKNYTSPRARAIAVNLLKVTQDSPDLATDLILELVARCSGEKSDPFKDAAKDFYKLAMLED